MTSLLINLACMIGGLALISAGLYVRSHHADFSNDFIAGIPSRKFGREFGKPWSRLAEIRTGSLTVLLVAFGVILVAGGFFRLLTGEEV
jgi:hypothetical protein